MTTVRFLWSLGHPTRETMGAAILNRLSAEANQLLAEHIAGCPGCQALFARVQEHVQLMKEVCARPGQRLPWNDRAIDAFLAWKGSPVICLVLVSAACLAAWLVSVLG